MITWLMTSAWAAWILVAIIVAATASENFVVNIFWGLVLLGVGVFTIMFYLADAPQPNLLLVMLAAVTAPIRLLIGR